MGYGWLGTFQDHHQCLLQGEYFIFDNQGADGIVMVYDVTNQGSFEDVDKFWISEVENYAEKNVELLLIGNKSDLDNRAYIIYQKPSLQRCNRKREPICIVEDNGIR